MHDVWGEARAVLPAWVPWFCLLPALAAGPWAWLSARSLAALALRRDRSHADAQWHWSERARHAYPARVAAQLSVITFVVAAAMLPWLLRGPIASLSKPAQSALGVVSALLGSMTALLIQERRLRPDLTVAVFLRGVATGSLVRYPQLIVAFGAAATLPSTLRLQDAPAFAAASVLLAAAACGAGLHVGRAVGLVQASSQRLCSIVATVAGGHQLPALWTMQLSHANAFAFPLLHCLAFTPQLERLLSDEELAEVASHELGHLSEPVWFRWLRGAVAFWLLAPLCAVRVLSAHYGMWGPVFGLFNALTVALCFQVASRRMETRADHATHDSVVYARALERIYEANLIPAVLPGRGASHPHLYDRLLAVGVTPAYPRPAPPRTRWLTAALFCSCYVYMAAPQLLLLDEDEPPSTQQLLMRLAVQGGDAWTLGELARRRWQTWELAPAARLYRGALQLAPNELSYAHGLIWTLVGQQRCQELDTTIDQLESAGDAALRASLQQLRTVLPRCMPQPELAGSEAAH